MEHQIVIDQKNGWKGIINVEIPLSHHRLCFIATLGANRMVTASDKDTEARLKAMEINVPIMAKAYEEAKKYIRGVDLKNGEEVVKDLDILECHPELDECWLLIASKYLEGYGPGKKKSRN